MMRRAATSATLPSLALAGLIIGGCTARPMATLFTTPAAERPPAAVRTDTSSLAIDLRGGKIGGRHLLFADFTLKVKVTIEAADIDKPYEATADIKPDEPIVVTDIPIGEKRIVTVQWLDKDNGEIEGLLVRAITDLGPGGNTVPLNDTTTAAGSILKDILGRNKEKAANTDPSRVADVVARAMTELKLPSPRFLNIPEVAKFVEDFTGKGTVTVKPEWAVKPGWISMGFQDFPPGMPLRVTISDLASSPAFTNAGETLLIGPILPRDNPYLLKITPLEDSPDLTEALQSMAVRPDMTIELPAIGFASNRPPAKDFLPEPIAHGPFVVKDGATPELWVVNGVVGPSVEATTLGDTRVKTSLAMYKYTRAAKWTKPTTALPADFPAYDFATAINGAKIYCFGGFVGDTATSASYVIDTAVTPPVPVRLDNLPQDDFNENQIAQGLAAAIGGKIYITGGTIHAGRSPETGEQQFKAVPDVYVYDTATSKFGENIAGPPGEGESESTEIGDQAAGAVVDGKWVIAGGTYGSRQPLANTWIFDPAGGTWKKGAPMPTPRYGMAAVTVGKQVFFIGGERLKGQASSAVEAYDPVTDHWTRRLPLQTARSFASALLVKEKINNKDEAKIYVSGGFLGFDPSGFGATVAKDKVDEIPLLPGDLL